MNSDINYKVFLVELDSNSLVSMPIYSIKVQDTDVVINDNKIIRFDSSKDALKGYEFLKHLMDLGKILPTDPNKLLRGYDSIMNPTGKLFERGPTVPLQDNINLSDTDE